MILVPGPAADCPWLRAWAIAADLFGDLAGHLEQIVIEQEETGQLVIGDDVQFFVEAVFGFLSLGRIV